jgi:hypothetical protein
VSDVAHSYSQSDRLAADYPSLDQHTDKYPLLGPTGVRVVCLLATLEGDLLLRSPQKPVSRPQMVAVKTSNTPIELRFISARQWRQQQEREIVDERITLVSIPYVASDHTNIMLIADMVSTMMKRRGISPRLVSVPRSNPIVFGEILATRRQANANIAEVLGEP